MHVKVLGKLSPKVLHLFKDMPDFKNSEKDAIIVFCSYSEFDIPIGHIFSCIIKEKEYPELFECSIRLEKVTQQFVKLFDEIPHGWKTICKFKILDWFIPPVINELPTIDDWFASNQYLIFSDRKN